MDIGTFLVEQLPAAGQMLMLAIKRRDTWSTAADFSSHIFADIKAPQVALVDAYVGPAKSELEVLDVPTGLGVDEMHKMPSREEKVHFGSVVEVDPGSYEWSLLDLRFKSHAEKMALFFNAAEGMTYTVLRVGAQVVGGSSFAEELIVWPNDNAIVSRGGIRSDDGNKGLFGLPTRLEMPRSNSGPQILNLMTLTV